MKRIFYFHIFLRSMMFLIKKVTTCVFYLDKSVFYYSPGKARRRVVKNFRFHCGNRESVNFQMISTQKKCEVRKSLLLFLLVRRKTNKYVDMMFYWYCYDMPNDLVWYSTSMIIKRTFEYTSTEAIKICLCIDMNFQFLIKNMRFPLNDFCGFSFDCFMCHLVVASEWLNRYCLDECAVWVEMKGEIWYRKGKSGGLKRLNEISGL